MILLTLISLNLYYSSHSLIAPYPDTLPIKETIHMTDKEIVYTIVKQELSYYKNKSLFANGKIFDYKDISVYSPTIYSVVFSIQSVMTIFGYLVMGLYKKIIGLLINQIICNLSKKKIIIVLFL